MDSDEEREKWRPRRGKRIISDKQARSLANQTVEEESFLNDPTIVEEPSFEQSYRRPTIEEMRKQAEKQRAERAAEYKAMGRTGREGLAGANLPPIQFNFPAHVSTSESEPDSDKENDSMTSQKEEKEKEADESTPLAQQRDTGQKASSTDPTTVGLPATPPTRPDKAFVEPALPSNRAKRGPSTSTPKVNGRARDSFGAAFGAANISVIANTSLQATDRRTSTTSTRKESVESRGTLGSLDEAEGLEEEEVSVNGTFVVNEGRGGPMNGTYTVEEREAAGGGLLNGTYTVEEEQREEQAVHVRIQSVVMRRVPSPVRDATMDRRRREEEEKGHRGRKEERVEVLEVSMRRQSPPRRQSVAAPRDVTMMSIDEGDEEGQEGRGRREQREEREESMEMDDVEMESIHRTPVRPQSTRPAKRASMEHPLSAASSPMAVTMAMRTGGMRETMVRPKVSLASTATAGRKISTGSVHSSIPFEDVSQRDLSIESNDRSYEEAKTPERTPRTNRLLRQSLAARDMRQAQMQQRLTILEETEMQGGERDEEEEEEEEEEMEMRSPRREEREPQSAAVRTPIATTPVNRAHPLSARLQSSVDRLSQPRHRHDNPARPCARANSPARAATPLQRTTTSSAGTISPMPPRRLNNTMMNMSRGAHTGYTPQKRIDTTLMEDDGNAKSGMAPRIKRVPRRDQTKKGGGVLNLSDEQLDVEEERRRREQQRAAAAAVQIDNGQSRDTSVISHRLATPIVSPMREERKEREEEEEEEEEEEGEEEGEEMHQSFHSNHSFNGNNHAFPLQFDDMRAVNVEDGEEEEEEEEEEGEEREERDEPNRRRNHSTASSTADDAVFRRPQDPLPSTPKGGGRRSTTSSVGGRSVRSESDAGSEAMDRLSSRASLISIADGNSTRGGAAAGAPSMDGSFGGPATPKTPFAAFRRNARNADLFSTDTPGVNRDTPTYMDTEEEEEWAADQPSQLWRGNVSTEDDENAVATEEDSQISIVEEEDANARVLAPRKLIAPTASPGVRRSTRTRMKPVRGWLGEQAQYEMSPSGGRRLTGVNEVVIKDKIFVQTGTADIQKAVLAKKKTAKQRGIANKKRKEQRRSQEEGEESE